MVQRQKPLSTRAKIAGRIPGIVFGIVVGIILVVIMWNDLNGMNLQVSSGPAASIVRSL